MGKANDLIQANSEQNEPNDYLEAFLLDSDSISTFLSHELRTPLTSITGVLGLLQAGYLGSLSDEGRSFINIAMNSVARLVRLTHAIEHNLTDSTPILSASEIKNFQLENDLIVAFEQHSFQLFYQPIIAIESNEMIGFEVILKWLNSQDEWIDPPVFLPLAQRLGLIEELTQWQIEQACQQLRVWQQQYPIHTGLTININLSIAQFLQPNFIPTLKGILQATGISPANLSLSIAEISFIQNHESMFSVIASLKALGIQCCMADFSISYFTLNILKDLSIDTLKVKCSLLTNKTWKVSKAILAIAKKLGLTTIVEEVESLEKVSFLKTLGCNQAQGHFFSEPVDAETARVFLSTFSLRH